MLENDGCKNYFYLKRDVELTPLYQPDTPMESKLDLLRSKIKFLEMRKNKQ